MTIGQVTRIRLVGALVGLLLGASGCGNKDAARVEETKDENVKLAEQIDKDEAAEFDQTAVLAKFDAAIANTDDVRSKVVLETMRQCVERDKKDLTIYESRLFKLPPEIGLLTNLTVLELSGPVERTELTTLPPEIGQLTNLTRLRLGGHKLTALPPEIGKLSKLTELHLRGNKLTSLPPEIGELTSLTELDLGDCQLSALPPGFAKLRQSPKSGIPCFGQIAYSLQSVPNR